MKFQEALDVGIGWGILIAGILLLIAIVSAVAGAYQ